jgi:hypothetical protein
MEVTIEFKTKKDYRRFMRNYHLGNGTTISQKHVNISHEGEGFLDSIKSVGKDLGKTVLKEVVKKGAQELKNKVISKAPAGLNTIGNTLVDLASNETQKKVNGMGLFSNAMSMAKNASKSKIGKDLMKAGVNAVSQQVSNKLENQTGMVGGIGSVLNNAVKNEAMKAIEANGSGFQNYLGGNGLNQSVANVNDRMAYVRAHKRGGSFRLP